ncbi:RDD family protein [Spongiactinospora sp. TRM90649]|uniref:RDD family protein n=1 Tax=Spongiactinospora sp. TRM90649 TaxID=3031114 RepID=UPI0023F715F8|nr:RDD family protein [Spongiactinospora sp. TRM90649]MDF5755638.1 RDD family protein [Spongiactinospora sp. TRM90649]
MSSRQGPRWTQSLLIGIRGDDKPGESGDSGESEARLGLPREGSGSMASWPRRVGALLIDWLICTWAITQGIFGVPANEYPLVPIAILAAEYILLVGTMGMTLGMRLTGIRVASADGGRPAVPAVLLRTLLLCLAIPALVWDRDRRGLHDRAAGTVVVHL